MVIKTNDYDSFVQDENLIKFRQVLNDVSQNGTSPPGHTQEKLLNTKVVWIRDLTKIWLEIADKADQ